MVDLRDSEGRHWQITIGSADALCDDELVLNEHSFEIDARPNRLWVNGQLAHTVKVGDDWWAVSYTHLRANETREDLLLARHL